MNDELLNGTRKFSPAEKLTFLFVGAVGLWIFIHLLSAEFPIVQMLTPVILFPVSSIVALPTIFRLTKSNLRRFVIAFIFFAFPVVLLFVLVFLGILFGKPLGFGL